MVDPEVWRRRVQLLPQGARLALHVGLVAVLGRVRRGVGAPPTHHQAKHHGHHHDNAARHEDGVEDRRGDPAVAGAADVGARAAGEMSAAGPIADHRAVGSIALTITGLTNKSDLDNIKKE